jgi:hypothetical protein
MEQGAQAGPGWRDLLWKEAINAACQILDTKAGPLFLQDHCPAGVVERLSAESGLHTFAHLPEREYQLLLALAKRPETKLTLAYTPRQGDRGPGDAGSRSGLVARTGVYL